MVVVVVLFDTATGEISRSPASWLGLKQIRDEVEDGKCGRHLSHDAQCSKKEANSQVEVVVVANNELFLRMAFFSFPVLGWAAARNRERACEASRRPSGGAHNGAPTNGDAQRRFSGHIE